MFLNVIKDGLKTLLTPPSYYTVPCCDYTVLLYKAHHTHHSVIDSPQLTHSKINIIYLFRDTWLTPTRN